MFKRVGICGTGNMGQAIAAGIISSGLITGDNLFLYNRHREKAEQVALSAGGGTVLSSLQALAAQAELIILAVKPYAMPAVLAELRNTVSEGTVVLSVAAGVTLQRMAEGLGKTCKLIRSMPNTPALVGEGMTALTANASVTETEMEDVKTLFTSFGKAEVVEEAMMDAVCGLSGSGPAYVYLFIEALADGAVLEGMPRRQAYTFAAQTVLGAAKLVLESQKHPGELKDAVCSPGGTTIAAVKVLEERGLRAAVMAAVEASAEKNKKI